MLGLAMVGPVTKQARGGKFHTHSSDHLYMLHSYFISGLRQKF